MSDFLPDDLREMMNGLIGLYDLAYLEVKKDVEYIILNEIKDEYIIEHMFDSILNIPTYKGYELFADFCDYVSTFNQGLVDDYVESYDELYGDEDEETTMKF